MNVQNYHATRLQSSKAGVNVVQFPPARLSAQVIELGWSSSVL